jgi:hypothetical protein
VENLWAFSPHLRVRQYVVGPGLEKLKARLHAQLDLELIDDLLLMIADF